MSNTATGRTAFQRMFRHPYMWLGLGLLLLLVIGGAAARKRRGPIQAIVVTVNGPEQQQLIREKDIRNLIKARMNQDLVGVNANRLNLEQLEQLIESDPFIEKADVYINVRHQLCINITQREPLLRVFGADGESYYLDAEGAKVPLSAHYTSRTLTATGNIPPHTPDYLRQPEHNLTKLYRLARYVQRDRFLRALVQQIHVTEINDFILVPTLGDQRINIGNPTEQLDDKLRRLEAFYVQALPHHGWRKYHTINLKYKGQVVTSRRRE